MTIRLFITGTDTDVGKTYITKGILKACTDAGYDTLGIKPVASGCISVDGKLVSEDTLAHQQHASIPLTHDELTPFAFEEAIAPHLAAEIKGISLSVEALNQQTQHALHYPADVSIIEGCGGWYVPLNATETLADFVIANRFKVILVVGIRLGCINHALLTCRAMQEDGADVIGWIANCIDPDMKRLEENIATLKEWLPIPCLSVVGHGESPEKVFEALAREESAA